MSFQLAGAASHAQIASNSDPLAIEPSAPSSQKQVMFIQAGLIPLQFVSCLTQYVHDTRKSCVPPHIPFGCAFATHGVHEP